MNKVLCIFICVIFISCSTDDDPSAPQQLKGNWYLTHADCFCGFEEEIELTDYKLHFETNDNILHLFNPPGAPVFIAGSGTYTYELQKDVILIEDAAPFRYELKGAELILTLVDNPSLADDELVLVFQKE